MEVRNKLRLAEIQARLKPVLDDLGLTARITKPLGSERIEFVNDDGRLKHAVEIRLAERSGTDETVTWAGSYMSCCAVEEVAIADSGWNYNVYHDVVFSEPFDDDVDATFQYIEDCLGDYPIIRQGTAHPDLVDDYNFGPIYQRVEEALDQATGQLVCDRTDGVFSIEFTEDDSDDLWRISFVKSRVLLSINGEQIADAEADDHPKAVRMINSRLSGPRFSL